MLKITVERSKFWSKVRSSGRTFEIPAERSTFRPDVRKNENQKLELVAQKSGLPEVFVEAKLMFCICIWPLAIYSRCGNLIQKRHPGPEGGKNMVWLNGLSAQFVQWRLGEPKTIWFHLQIDHMSTLKVHIPGRSYQQITKNGQHLQKIFFNHFPT